MTAASIEERIRDTLAALDWLRGHCPGWAIWCDARRRWTATRAPRAGEQPAPGSHLVWVEGDDIHELKERIAPRPPAYAGADRGPEGRGRSTSCPPSSVSSESGDLGTAVTTSHTQQARERA